MKLPWKYIVVSFVIGLLAGGSVGLCYSHHLAHEWMRKSPTMYLRRLDRELHLNDVQRTQILTVLNAKRDKIAAVEDDVRKTSRVEIRAFLMPDQQTRFDAMTAKHDADRAKRKGS